MLKLLFDSEINDIKCLILKSNVIFNHQNLNNLSRTFIILHELFE